MDKKKITFELVDSFDNEIEIMDLLLQVIEKYSIDDCQRIRILEWFNARMNHDISKRSIEKCTNQMTTN